MFSEKADKCLWYTVYGWLIHSPVEADAQHPVGLQGCYEQVAVLSCLAERRQGSGIEGDLTNSAAITVRQAVCRAVQEKHWG